MSGHKIDITILKNRIEPLMECVDAYKSNTHEQMQSFIEDSCVKRFEFTVETA